MAYKEYFLISGCLLSFILTIFIFILYNKNKKILKKYKEIDDVKQSAKDIFNNAIKEKEEIIHNAVIDLDTIKNEIKEIEVEKKHIQSKIDEMREEYRQKRIIYDDLMNKISISDNKVEYIEMGFENIEFQFDDTEEYKEAIESIRNKQKDMAKNKKTVTCSTGWKINGSAREGRKMVDENIKVTLRAFNNECDVIIGRVTWRNYSQSCDKIKKAFEFFNNYNKTSDIKISDDYLKLKLEELKLIYENQERKQQVKEEQRAIREQIREEERFERDRIAAEKEEEKYKKLLKKAQEEAQKATGEKLNELNKEVEKLSALLKEAEEKNQRALSMAQQTKAGHVYIISNIGSFGDDVFKIGMTRRLDPYERIYELGGASVPFEFDVHAMISCKDAPSLENKLHKIFEKYKMNLVNNRREFFKVSLDEIEKEVKKQNPKTEFIRTSLAEQYRKSQVLRKQRQEVNILPSENELPDSI